MSQYGEVAAALFNEGYNCAQSVAGAFAEKFGISLDAITKLSSGFGGGIAGKREMCGAVSGMIIAIGLGCGYSGVSSPQEKKAHYELCSEAMEQFKKQAGSIVCSELLKMKRENVSGRPCGIFCEIAADIAAEKIGG